MFEPSQSRIEEKSYSLLPMETGRTGLRAIGPTPSDQSLMRAYEESPWLNAKLFRVCSSIAMMNFTFGTENEGGIFTPLPRTYPLWRIMRHPNTSLTGFDFRFLTMLYARVHGEVYWRLMRGGIGPVSLWLYPREWISPVFGRGGEVISYIIRARTYGGMFIRPETVSPADMVWLRHPDPLDPYVKGIGEVMAGATELDTFELASESDRRFFENDAQPPGAIIVPGTPTPDERKRIIDDWNSKVGGPERQGSIPILSGGLDYKQFRQTRKEMDFIQGQEYLRDVIIRGVHKHIMGISDDVNLASAKAAEFTYARWELMPDVVWLQENINLKLLPLVDARAQIRFDSPVPADEVFELEKANEGVTRGVLTRNEWRKVMGFPLLPPDKGEVFLLPIAVLEIPVDSPPRDEPPSVDPNPDPGDNDEKPRLPGDQGARSVKASPVARKQLTPNDLRDILAEVEDDDLIRRLLSAYEATIRGRFEDAVQEVGATPSFDVSSLLTRRYMAEEAAVRVAGINDVARVALREALQESIKTGESLRDVADRINDLYSQFKGDRSVLIARTETIDASRWTALETYKANGVEGKEWLLAPDYDPAQDDGVCQDYADNGIILVNDSFVGDEGPLDGPTAHPGCRCAVAPVIDMSEDEPQQEAMAETDLEGSEGVTQQVDAQMASIEEYDEVQMERFRKELRSDFRYETGLKDQQIFEIESAVQGWTSGKTGSLEALVSGEGEVARAYQKFVSERASEMIGSEKILLYRGLSYSEGSSAEEYYQAAKASGGVVNYQAHGLSSWTTSQDIAEQFAKRGSESGRGIILQAEVNVKDIVASLMFSPGWAEKFFDEHEMVVRGVDLRVRVFNHLWAAIKSIEKSPRVPTVVIADDERTWHKPGRRPRHRRRKRYRGRSPYPTIERKQARITALGREHTRMERVFANVLRRAFQAQQSAMLKVLRS